MRKYITMMAFVALLLTGGYAQAAESSYPLDTCVVSGEKLGGDMGDPIIFQYEGHEVRFCCMGCKKTFLKDPSKYLKIIADAKAKADESK